MSMTVPTPLPPTTKVKGPRLLISIVILVLGLIVGAAGAVGFATGVWEVLDGPSYAIPGTVRLQLESGTYIAFEHSDTSIDASEVTVSDTSGRQYPVSASDANEEITRGSNSYSAAVEFQVPRAGVYNLRFDTSRPGRVIVEHPLESVIRDSVPWLLALVAGGLIGVAGFVMLIVGIVRRSRAKSTVPAFVPAVATQAALPAAAWFPDPHGQHRLRYWDGQTWTDHTSD